MSLLFSYCRPAPYHHVSFSCLLLDERQRRADSHLFEEYWGMDRKVDSSKGGLNTRFGADHSSTDCGQRVDSFGEQCKSS
jgi:hypothetical protein